MYLNKLITVIAWIFHPKQTLNKNIFRDCFAALAMTCCFVFCSFAQSSQLTFEQATEIALKNNYNISIAKNLEKEAKNANSLGNAGMLPVVSINASGTQADNAIKQEYSTGTSLDRKGIISKNISTGAYLTWTVFDGLKMFATKEQLAVLESMGMLNTKVQIENTLVQLINDYYNIVMLKQMIKGLKENMAVSEERLKIAQKKFDIGNASKVDLLQAKVDLNSQKAALIRENTLLSDAKETLNQLLILPVDKDFEVADTIPLLNDYKYEDLKNAITTKNSDLLFAQRNIDNYKYIEVDSTFDSNKAPIYINTTNKLNKANLPKMLPTLATQIKSICESHQNEKGIIHTHTMQITEYLQKSLKGDRFLFRDSESKNDSILSKHSKSKEPTVIVSPSMTFGIDLKDSLARFQIIVKAAFLPLGDDRIKRLFDEDKAWYTNKMLVNLVQACGRGIRSKDDHCITYILDGSVYQVVMDNKRHLPKYFIDRFV